VFVSFTLSQWGMVYHWRQELTRTATGPARRAMRRSQAINATGAVLTGVVLVVVLVTKFSHGAWIVTIAMPSLFWTMHRIRRHYDEVAVELTPKSVGLTLPSRIHAVVPVSQVNEPTLRALAFARATRPDTLTAVTVQVDEQETRELLQRWAAYHLPVPLTVLDSPYRDLTSPVVEHVRELRRQGPRDVVCVFVPEYVVGHWWEQVLHNQSALRLKARLLSTPGVVATSVPYQLASSAHLLTDHPREVQHQEPAPEGSR
jgi:hypothetical protein